MKLTPSKDGTSARVHVPGSCIPAMEFARLVEAASDGDGHVHITSSESIQIRGLGGAGERDLVPDDEVEALARGVEDRKYEAVPLGWIERSDGLVDLGAAVAFGMISAKVAQLLTVLEADISLTDARTLVIHGLEPHVAEAAVRVLAPLGLSFDEATDLVRISACVGAPTCRYGLSDVRSDALRSGAAGRVHFIGCERACGRPPIPHTEYLATGEGEYEVTDRPG